MKKKETYILQAYGQVKAVIVASNQEELMKKTALAIEEEECVEKCEGDEPTVVKFPETMGDYGEDTNIVAIYVNDGEQITNTDYILTKTVSY